MTTAKEAQNYRTEIRSLMDGLERAAQLLEGTPTEQTIDAVSTSVRLNALSLKSLSDVMAAGEDR